LIFMVMVNLDESTQRGLGRLIQVMPHNQMDAILASINNRDIAFLFWLLILLGWIFSKAAVRKSFGGFWRAFAQHAILIAFGLAAATTALLCYCLSLAGLWDVSQLKGSVVWFIAACIPSMMDIPKLSEDFGLFRKAALKNFELSILVDFYLNIFQAPMLAEIIIIPVAATLTGMLVLSETRDELKQAHGVVTKSLAFIGISWLAFQTYKLFTSFNEIRNLDTIRDFVLPISLNLAFLPVLALYTVYAAYDSIFARIRFVVKDPRIHRFTKFAILARCGPNYMRAHRWFKSAWHADLNNRSSVWRSIGEA